MTTSSRLQAVHEALIAMVEKLTAKLNERVLVGRMDISREEIETFARMARGMAYDSVTDAYRRGFRDGVQSVPRNVEVGPDDPTPRPIRATRSFEAKR